MVALGVALGMIAPYYNLVLVIVVLFLFRTLFTTEQKAKTYVYPWKLLFLAVLVFIVEEGLTVLRSAGLIDIPIHINAYFELVIIALFIYALLSQNEFVKKRYG